MGENGEGEHLFKLIVNPTTGFLLQCMILGLLVGLIYGAIGMLILWSKCDENKKGGKKTRIEKEVERIVEENPGMTPEGVADMLHELLYREGVKSIRFRTCLRFTINVNGKTETVVVDYPV